VADRPELPDALRAALAQLAQVEVPEILSEARALARARAKALIEDALVEELLRAAGESSSAGSGDPSELAESGRRRRPARGERREAEPPAPRARSARQGTRSRAPRGRSAPGSPESPAPRPSPAREDPEPETGDAWWAYCILADPEAAPVGAPGVESDREVDLVRDGDLVAVVSAVPLSEYSDDRLREHLNDIDWVERVARAHERVLDQTLERATILPLRLCTLYRDRDGVRRMLREQKPTLLEELSELEGHREWGAKVFVDQERLADALEAAPGGEAPEPGEHRSAGVEYMARLGRDRQASERLQEIGDSVVEEIHAALEAIADKARTNPLQRPELHGRAEQMLLNGAYLVSRQREQELAQTADSLRERWSASGFQLELTGPWPPYNFVSPSAMVTP
jgi:hypothetical protein